MVEHVPPVLLQISPNSFIVLNLALNSFNVGCCWSGGILSLSEFIFAASTLSDGIFLLGGGSRDEQAATGGEITRIPGHIVLNLAAWWDGRSEINYSNF